MSERASLTRLLKSKRWTGLKALMAFEQSRGNKAGNMSLFASINANIPRLILEYGDRLKVRRTFRWVRHRLDLLSQSCSVTACITRARSRVERREAVDVVLPPTYEKLAMRSSHTHEGSALIPQ